MERFTAYGQHTLYLYGMKTQKVSNKELYYILDHKWVDFQESIAHMNVCKIIIIRRYANY